MIMCFIVISYKYLSYRKDAFIHRLEKAIAYSDQSTESTTLRTGTYMVDHLKLTTIVGMFLLTSHSLFVFLAF